MRSGIAARALSNDPRQPRFIETRHRRGYRFIAPVSEPAPDAPHDPPDPGGISTIAVLPFADMSPEHDQDYLCDGLSEELINALTHIDGLRVAARTASFQFRGGAADIRGDRPPVGRGGLAGRQRAEGGRSFARDG